MLTTLRHLCWGALVLLPALWGRGETAEQTRRSRGSTVELLDVTQAAGITFLHQSAAEKRYIVESMGGGVAIFDFDRDGWLDLYLLNSSTVEGALAGKARPKAALYRNLGNGTFREVADAAGLADPGWAMGVAVADYDNDGWDDLYVTCFGPNRLYRNRGNGTFEEVTKRAGVGDDRFSTGAAWGDYDRDGDLDLAVANYVDFSLEDLPQFGKGPLCQYKNLSVQCGPRGLPGAGDSLYRNNGDGTFTEVSAQAGVDDPAGYYGLGVVWSDLDEDGWPDLFIANDATPNYFYRNNQDGTFREEGLVSGLAVDESGLEQGCMGIALGDYDRDGRIDLFVTNFADQYNTLYRNLGDGIFSDLSRASQISAGSVPLVGWGTGFFDVDHDGWLDLLVVNGHVYPQVEGAFPGGLYRQPKLFSRNRGDGTFVDASAWPSQALQQRRASRGAAWGDFDNDGDLDILVNELDGMPMLLRNEGGHRAGSWLNLKLVGTRSNRNAIGTRVSLRAGSRRYVDEVRAGGSYLSHSDRRLHFGLGAATHIDEIRIEWPSGMVETLPRQAVNQFLTLQEPAEEGGGIR
jgi:hypothetical protein